ncbi:MULTISPECIES: DUF3000 domain-containing protein [Propionimicrobium]|uniref:DUF3000 family protein n=1 Tax=Propionimicrobium lymphophilum ACS-093-V-SCH5 TaxID=883161 RepID=S2W5D6_9ACTN|nr:MULTISPECIES: DUF3000 domain-containing protein [Propionimicrobium]EPD33485.1 hypothetical protein HMPREF9306_01025 [Propionimicrobium lymphophilum ACS-093-V-SCH5]ETJ98243.1 PF11452 family protein [Propionimicrobium sp. BV2F7]
MSVKPSVAKLPTHQFDDVCSGVLNFQWRPEIKVSQMPSPQRIAPFSVAIEADIDRLGEEVGTARLVILHDPDGNPAWDGTYRCVSFVQADVDIEMAMDPLLTEVGWNWLNDSLGQSDAEFHAASGTVTAVTSRSFGALAEEPDTAEIEIRSSWTADIDDRGIIPHLEAWQQLMCFTCGMPPLAPGVVSLSRRTNK